MTASPSASALLFDLGGVVIAIDFTRAFARWAAYSQREPAVIGQRFSFDSAYAAHERGAIGAAEYFAHLRKALDIDISDAEFLDGWNAIFLQPIPGMAEVLESLSRAVPVYLLSNSNVVHEQFWRPRYADILANFRHIFVSSTIGHRKPDATAFAYVVGKIGVPADRIMFFDDLAENVHGARACGMPALHVRELRDVEKACRLWLGAKTA